MHDLANVAIITVNYASHHLLERNLALLSGGVDGPLAVVCDNYTSDAERAAVAALSRQHSWIFVPSQRNGGFAAGCNLAAEAAIAAGAEHLVLLNPDARTDTATLQALLAAVRKHPDTVASPLMFDAAGRPTASARKLRMADGTMVADRSTGPIAAEPGVVPWLTGACLMIPVPLWQRLGGLAEEYFMYWEDVEFSYRAQQLGARLEVVAEGSCVHDQGGTQRSEDDRDDDARKSTTFFYYWARNRLLFAARNLDAEGRSAWLRSSGRAAWYVLKRARGRRRALLQSPSEAAALLRGVREGRRVKPSGGEPRGAALSRTAD